MSTKQATFVVRSSSCRDGRVPATSMRTLNRSPWRLIVAAARSTYAGAPMPLTSPGPSVIDAPSDPGDVAGAAGAGELVEDGGKAAEAVPAVGDSPPALAFGEDAARGAALAESDALRCRSGCRSGSNVGTSRDPPASDEAASPEPTAHPARTRARLLAATPNVKRRIISEPLRSR